jgi:hypothetical protein
VRKIALEASPEGRAAAAARRRARYARDKDREKAAARARYWADPERHRAAKRIENLSLRQRVRAAASATRKYYKNREAILARTSEREMGKKGLAGRILGDAVAQLIRLGYLKVGELSKPADPPASPLQA